MITSLRYINYEIFNGNPKILEICYVIKVHRFKKWTIIPQCIHPVFVLLIDITSRNLFYIRNNNALFYLLFSNAQAYCGSEPIIDN